ncbi:MAG: alpha/beta hydrolase [Candidatus Methanoperedens sp.]|nr:alpha/beta hydrolase [Candidatus Methanoperedens sp.]
MNSKKRQPKTKSKEIEKKSGIKLKILIAIIGAILLLAVVYFLFAQGSDTWTVSKDGILSYPENRGKVDVKVLNTTKGSNYTLETISFASKDYTVEGLLRIPSSDKKMPAVVILPGATVPKEGTQGLAELLSNLGYASLGIEQRNRGGVNPQYDYELFKAGEEPIEHKMVFDALRSVDVLKQDSRIEAKRIAIIGESNGGRFAIIAAAIDPEIEGVIGISTSGYDTESQTAGINDETLIRFYRSIDPDTYLGFLPPRKLVMLHSDNDNIIPIDLAKKTFEKAKEPKQFYNVTTGTHGFSEGMREPIENEIRQMLG